MDLRSLALAILDAVFPCRCLLCGETLDRCVAVCPSCRTGLPFIEGRTCRLCSKPVSEALESDICLDCRGERPKFSELRAFLFYDEEVRTLVHALKFQGRHSVASAMAEMVAGRADPSWFLCDGLVPVPLHPSRLAERGYNQAELLAHGLARRFGLRVFPSVLVRTKATRPQSSLAGSERAENVHGAFRLTRAARRLEGKSVILVDDVVTTGETVRAAAKELAKAGLADLRVFALARPR